MDTLLDTKITDNAFNRGVDAASGSMHKAIDTASGAAAPAIKHMTKSAHSTVDKMAGGAHFAAEALSHKGEQLHDLQQQLTKSTRSKVRDNPLLAIGIAVAGGVLLSWWLNRPHRRPDVS